MRPSPHFLKCFPLGCVKAGFIVPCAPSTAWPGAERLGTEVLAGNEASKERAGLQCRGGGIWGDSRKHPGTRGMERAWVAVREAQGSRFRRPCAGAREAGRVSTQRG